MNASVFSLAIRNITISGRAASGATTLSRKLAEKLGWQLINGGEIYRQYVRKNNIPLEATTQVSDTYHLGLDQFIKDKLLKEKSLIIESWLSGFDAQNIEGVFKIFVTCPDDSVRIDRLVNREKMTIEQAKEHIKIREEENVKKWTALYKTDKFWDESLYDLIINTYENGPVETLEIALEGIRFYKLT